MEFGHGQVGRVDVDFLSGPKPTGTYQEPSEALVAEKAQFGSSRLQRWFGRPGRARLRRRDHLRRGDNRMCEISTSHYVRRALISQVPCLITAAEATRRYL